MAELPSSIQKRPTLGTGSILGSVWTEIRRIARPCEPVEPRRIGHGWRVNIGHGVGNAQQVAVSARDDRRALQRGLSTPIETHLAVCDSHAEVLKIINPFKGTTGANHIETHP